MSTTRYSLKPKIEEKRPVFVDPIGNRGRLVHRILRLGAILLIVWLCIFAISLSTPPQDQQATIIQPNSAAPAGAVRLSGYSTEQAVADYGYGPGGKLPQPVSNPCQPQVPPQGSALAAVGPDEGMGLFAFLPNDPPGGFLSLGRNCGSIDVLIPEWLEITPDTFELASIKLDPEMIGALSPILSDQSSAPRVISTLELSYLADKSAFLARLRDSGFRADLVKQISLAAIRKNLAGVCLPLDYIASTDLMPIELLLADLRVAFAETGKQTCSIASAEDVFWQRPALIANSDIVIVRMFLTPWIGSKPGPLADGARFAQLAKQVLATVGPQKLVMAIGTHSADWVTGRTLPEEISFAEAMTRISDAGANVQFSKSALNSYSNFIDRDGKRHQIWMLDAPSAQNALTDLSALGVRSVAVGALGLEDPGLWTVIDSFQAETQNLAADLRYVSLGDSVSYTGEGPFYRIIGEDRAGVRNLRVNSETGHVLDQSYSAVPRPYLMERYGGGNVMQVALTFDDGPDAVATGKILDALKDANAPATFFVVGKAALESPGLLRRMVDEGHIIGSHTFLHPEMTDLKPWRTLLELNSVQNLVAGETGKTVHLFRPPYLRGPGPLSGAEAAAFSIIAENNYIVTGSDIVPRDWTGISAEAIVEDAMTGVNNGEGNIVVLHDGRNEGVHTAEAIPLLIKALRESGYQIVPLSTLLGVAPDVLMPSASSSTAVLSSFSFRSISSLIWGAFTLLWIFLLAGLARSTLFLIMAHRRQPQQDRWGRVLPTVSIIIPAYNEGKVILGSISTALAADYPDLKVIVVDDGSTDNTLELVRGVFGDHPQVTILTQRNQGKWRALNTAYEMITTEIAVCVDADTQIEKDAIRHIVQPFVNPRVGAVAGTILVGNKRNFLTRLQALEYFTMQNIARRAQEHINGIIVVPGALGAWRVEAVRDIGMFSNETLTEDTDLTIYMLRGGYSIAYAEKATGYTEVPADVRSLLKQRLRWNVGMLQALWKHKGAFGETRSLRLFSLVDLAVFGYILPLIAPLVDLLLLFTLFNGLAAIYAGHPPDFSDTSRLMLVGYLILPLFDLITVLAAFRLDRRESLRLLWVFPFVNLVYRQLMYISVYRAVTTAITGKLAGWGKLKRLGMAHRT